MSQPTPRQRGNVLILVIVVLGLLSLLGGAYLQTARVQRRTFANAGTSGTAAEAAQAARDLAIAEISLRLRDDIFDPETGVFLDHLDGTEPYDRAWTNPDGRYPVFNLDGTSPVQQAIGNRNDDVWLASTLPFIDASGVLRWRQISTLSGAYFDTTANADPMVAIDERLVGNMAAGQNEPDHYYGDDNSLDAGEDYNLDAFNDPTLVDADADGIPDSRLERLPRSELQGDVEFFAAVRIIDLGSFLNLNTALSSIDVTGAFGNAANAPRGLNPSELNAGQAVFGLNDNPTPTTFIDQLLRFNTARGTNGTDFDDRLDYWEDQASQGMVELDLDDELELRFRGGVFDFTDTTTRIDTATPDGLGGEPISGMNALLNQGLPTGLNGIVDSEQAENFFAFDPVGPAVPGTRIRLTTQSAEALLDLPSPYEQFIHRDLVQNQPDEVAPLTRRLLKQPLNRDGFELSYAYPPPPGAAPPPGPASPFGNNSMDATGNLPNRPAMAIQDSARDLTDFAVAVKEVYNHAFTTAKASAVNLPFEGDADVPVPELTPGIRGEPPVLYGTRVAADEAEVDLFATQMAANLKDYVDEDNLLTVLDAAGMPRPDRGSDELRIFPIGNSWSPTDLMPTPPVSVPNGLRYGFEAFPYITEVYVQADYQIETVTPATPPVGGPEGDFLINWVRQDTPSYAIEIRNPFNRPVSLNNIHLFVDASSAASPVGSGLDTATGVDEWTTDHPQAVLSPGTPNPDADADGDRIVSDFDLADLVTNALRISGAIADDESFTTLDPNEVLILYRNAGGADVVAPSRFSNATSPGVQETGSQQWNVAAPLHPTDSVIDDRNGDSFTYVELPFDWPVSPAPAAVLDGYPETEVTVELYAAVADDGSGFSVGITGGPDTDTAMLPNPFQRQRYQSVNTSIAPVDDYQANMVDVAPAGGPVPVEMTTVTLQHSTVGNGNGLNAMLIARNNFDTRVLYPDQFEVAQGTESDTNNGLQDLIATDTVVSVSREAVYAELINENGGDEFQQALLGLADKTQADSFTADTPNANEDVLTNAPDAQQVRIPNEPMEYEMELAQLLLLGIEPIRPGSPLTTGTTADSFFNNSIAPDTATLDTLSAFRINLGFAPGSGFAGALPLAAANNSVYPSSGAASVPLWDRPHAQFLVDRFTAYEGLQDRLPGRLNLNQVEPGLLAAALPFGDAGLRSNFANSVIQQRGDLGPLNDPSDVGLAIPSELLYGRRTESPIATPTIPPLNSPNAAGILGDTSEIGGSRVDFLTEDDGVADDIEERLMLGGAVQQVTTTRSDVFVAYILVQGYRDADGDGNFATAGQEEDGLVRLSRSIVLFDRSQLESGSDQVRTRVLYEFPN